MKKVYFIKLFNSNKFLSYDNEFTIETDINDCRSFETEAGAIAHYENLFCMPAFIEVVETLKF